MGRKISDIDVEQISQGVGVRPVGSTADFDAQMYERKDRSEWQDTVHRLKQARYTFDTKARKWLAWSTQGLIILWMAAVVVIMMRNTECFQLPSEVLITLLGTTTANVIGLAVVVLKGFFDRMNQDIDLKD